MAYTRPAYNAADATWAGLGGAYTRPAYNAANATFYVATGTISGLLSDGGLPLSPQVYGVVWRDGWISDSGLPLAPQGFGISNSAGWLSVPTMLGAWQSWGISNSAGYATDGGLPLPLLAQAYVDPTLYIDPAQPTTYVMDLVVSGARVRVPISSWQATLQTGNQCYVQCVVPACGAWLDQINAADEFILSRVGRLLPQYGSGSAEGELARSSVQTLQIDQGPTNHSATISGYADAFAELADPDTRYDRELVDVRSITTYGAGIRLRCGIDWLLRPGQRATYGTISFLVSYINYYATMYSASFDAYMDVGYREPS